MGSPRDLHNRRRHGKLGAQNVGKAQTGICDERLNSLNTHNCAMPGRRRLSQVNNFLNTLLWKVGFCKRN